MDIKALREKRNKAIYDARQIVERAVEKGEALSGEDKVKVEQFRAEALELGKTIQAAEEIEEAARGIVPDTQRTEPAKRDEAPRYTLRQFVSDVVEGRQRPAAEARALGTTGSAGGFTIAPDTSLYGSIEEAQKNFSAMEEPGVAYQFTTSTGADLSLPMVNDTANGASIVAEAGSHASGTDPSLTQGTFHAYVASTKELLINLQLLQDSDANFEAFVGRLLARRLAYQKNIWFTTGTGVSQPQGVVTGATLGRTGATGQTASVTADDIIRLYHSVDSAYRAGAKFMLNDATLLALALLKDGEGRYLLSGIGAGGPPDRLYGKPFIINPAMADMATSAKPILFGDFSNYWIRRVSGSLQMFVTRELHIQNLQYGMFLVERVDGMVVDAGTNPIKYYQNAAS